jgi:hypothetical protein
MAVPSDYIKRTSKNELIEESTIGNLSVTEIDDKNDPEQKTVTIDAAIGEVYEPAAPPKTSSRS